MVSEEVETKVGHSRGVVDHGYYPTATHPARKLTDGSGPMISGSVDSSSILWSESSAPFICFWSGCDLHRRDLQFLLFQPGPVIYVVVEEGANCALGGAAKVKARGNFASKGFSFQST